MKRKNYEVLVFFLLIFSLPLAFSAPVSDLNVSLVNTPPLLYKDLNFQTDWTQQDANTAYWQFGLDGNVTVVGSDINNFYDFENNNVDGWVDIDLTGNFNTSSAVVHSGNYAGDGNMSARWAINLTPGEDLNVSAWIRVTSVTGAGSLIGFINTANNYAFAIGFNRKVNDKFVVFDGSQNRDMNGTNPNVQADKWYKFVFQKKAGNKADAYVLDTDGTTVIATAINVNTVNDLNKFVIFADPDSGETYLDDITNQLSEPAAFPSPIFQSHTFTTSGTKTIVVTVENLDGNSTATLDITIPADTTGPVIQQFDVNTDGVNKWSSVLRCTDDVSTLIDYNLFVNTTRVYSSQDANNSFAYLNSQFFSMVGSNTFTAQCTDQSGNTTTKNATPIIFMQIKIPKDEDTLNLISPFNIISSDLNIFFTGLTADQNIAGVSLSLISQVYVDANADYYPRTYILDANSTIPLQPYLIPTGSGISVIFLTFNSITNAILGNVRLVTYRNLNGINTRTEDTLTDDFGQVALSFLPTYDYNILFYYGGNLIFAANYTPISSDSVKKAYLGLSNITGATGDEVIADINFGGYNLDQDASLDNNITINVTDQNVTRLDVNYSIGSLVISSATYQITDANTFPVTITTNLNTISYDTNQNIVASVQVTTTDGSKNFSSIYLVTAPGTTDLLVYGQNARGYLGTTLAGIIAVLVALAVCGIFTRIQPLTNPLGQILVVSMVLWFFLAIQWINGMTYTLGIFVGLLTSWGKALVEGN